jgi:putative copper resistance protein D
MTLSHILIPSFVRGIDLTGMVFLVGGLVFKTLVLFPTNGKRSYLERSVLFFLILTGLSDLLLRSHMISGRPLAEVWGSIPFVLFKSHFGEVWIARTVLLALLCVISMIPKRERLALAISGLLLLTTSLSSHAADSGDFSFSVLADWLHLVAASAWIGGLFFLASMLRNSIISRGLTPITESHITSLNRFCALVGVCVILILVTGSYQTWHQVGGLAALLQTTYGQTLLVKLLLILPLLALGPLMHRHYLPKLSQSISLQPVTFVKEARGLFNSVTLGIGLGLAVIACAALLMQQPSARGEWASMYVVSFEPMTHSSRGAAHPLKLPAEGAKVTILSPQEDQVFNGGEVPIKYKFTKGKRGSHLHVYVDGELMGMFGDPERGTLIGFPAGRHALELRAVTEDHETELEAADRVHFVAR